MSEKRLDKKKFLQRIIIACWVALVVCLIIKLFGGNLFNIVCKNETFIKICSYSDTHLWLDYILSSIYCFISMYFLVLAIIQEKKYKLWQLIVLIITVLVGTGIKLWNKTVGLIFDIWQGIGMPILFLGKKWKEYWKVIVGNILLVVFQLVSMYVKNIKLGILGDNNLIGLIFSLDILIMIMLYYGYSNLIKINKNKKKECEQDG